MLRRKLLSFLRNGVGAAGLLWIPTLYLLHEAFTPAPSAGVLGAVFVLGALLQGGLYLVANRGFFIGARPPLQLVAAAAGLAAAAAGVAGGLPLLLHGVSVGPALEIRPAALALAAAQLLALESSVFATRVGFRAMVEFAEAARERARAAARVLLPVGTFHLDRVLARLDQVSARAGAGQGADEARREIRDLAHELRLRWDDRFARFVPWASAARLVAAFLELLGARYGGRLQVAALDRRERLEAVPVRSATPCALLDAVAVRLPEGARIAVVSSAEAGGLRLSLSASGLADQRPEPFAGLLLDELRAALRSGVRVSREVTDAGWQIDLWYPAARAPGPVDAVERRFGAAELELLEGDEGSGQTKRVYRRGDEVLKVHFDAAFDPKPTLLEDEFYIMRRLSGHGRWFPEVTGTGRQPGYHWLSYRFEPGTPLDVWLADDAHRAHGLRILLDVHQVVQRLAELGVAHRDLNPRNVIVRGDGSLVLIDFDQAVADAPEYRGADLDGAAEGVAKNDLRSFLEQTDLARCANDAVRCLSEHWPSADAPFELGLAGHLFPGQEPWDQLWYPILEEVGSLAGRRVLDCGSAAPLFGLFAASHQAQVTIRPGSRAAAALVRDLGPRIGGHLDLADRPEDSAVADYDLAVCLEAPDVESQLEALPLERVAALAVTWPGDAQRLAERLGRAGLGAPRTIAFTSRLVPLLLCQRQDP
jgi:predicted Ser/Thr protein kinase